MTKNDAGRFALLAAAGLLVLIALGLLLTLLPGQRNADFGPGTSSRDPRLDYAGPFRNVDPAVRYVAEERCADCHLDKALSYAAHPMAHSLLPVAQAAAPSDGPEQNNPFQALGSQFLVEREGDRVRHRRTRLDRDGRPAATLHWEVHYVIGSGNHGHSYLTDRDGYLFQTPVSWYAQKKRWDLSPGFGQARLTGRAVPPDCLFCHANRVNHWEDSANRYTKPVFDGHAIGCQRCHGPGALHVASRERLEPVTGKVDDTVVNPRHLERSLRDAVCEQCHLEGEARTPRRGRGLYDFRPGLPLELFWSVFVRASEGGEGQKAVGHVDQMYQSRCFQGGAGPERLGCISCHDPHERVVPAERISHYRVRCLHCHQHRGCSLSLTERLRQTAGDSCIDCHMTRYGSSDIPHTASTDHRILRGAGRAARGEKPATPHAAPTAGHAAGDGFPVVSFYRGRKAMDDGEDQRDVAVVLVKLALGGEDSAVRVLRHATPALEAALQRDPDDRAAAEARGYALALQGRLVEALAAFEALLAKAPDRELALVGAAAMAEALGQTDATLRYVRRAVAINPWAPDYRRRLVLLLVKKEAWGEAQRECQAWGRLDPISTEARTSRLLCLLAAGNKDEARAEFARIEALAPANLRELQIRFGKKLR